MSTGYQDFQYLAGVNILGVAEEVKFTIKEVVGVVDVNIESVAGTVVFDVNVQGTVDVNIKSQETNITVTGTVDINAIASVVKIEPSEEAVFEIKPQAGVVFNISGSVNANITNSSLNVVVESGSVDVNVTNSSLNVVVSSGSIDANITNSTLNVVVQETVDVNITNSSVTVVVQSGTINANITNTSINVNVQNKVDVEIKNASIDVNVINSVLSVSVSGQASVSIDNASVYLNVKYEQMAGKYLVAYSESITNLNYDYNLGTYEPGFLFHNARGYIDSFAVYVKNTTGSDQTITIKIAIAPGYPVIYSDTATVPSTQTGYAWLTLGLMRKFWQYNTIYVRISGPSGVYIGSRSGRWGWGGFRDDNVPMSYIPILRIHYMGKSEGDIPVSGTVNTINIPNRTTKVSFSGTMTIVGWVEVINESFIGTVKKIVFEGSGGADLYGSEIRITIDDSVIIEGSLIDLALRRIARITYSTNSEFCSVIEMEVPVKNSLKIEILVDRTGLIEPHASVTAYYESLG